MSSTITLDRSFEIKANELVRQLNNVLLAAGTDDTLPILLGVELSWNSTGQPMLAATDRYFLIVATLDGSDVWQRSHDPATESVWLSTDACKLLVTALQPKKTDLVEVAVRELEPGKFVINVNRFGELIIHVSTEPSTAYPRHHMLWPELPTQPNEGPSYVGLGMGYLSKIAKIKVLVPPKSGQPPVELRMVGPRRPTVWQFPTDPTVQALLMPVRLAERV